MHKRAKVILQMIVDRDLDEFDRRMAMRNCRIFKTVAEIQPVLDFLDDYGYIALKPEKAMGGGRPPLPKYAVNPAVKKMFCPSVSTASQGKDQKKTAGKSTM